MSVLTMRRPCCGKCLDKLARLGADCADDRPGAHDLGSELVTQSLANDARSQGRWFDDELIRADKGGGVRVAELFGRRAGSAGHPSEMPTLAS
jgi:hypothetical protein